MLSAVAMAEADVAAGEGGPDRWVEEDAVRVVEGRVYSSLCCGLTAMWLVLARVVEDL